VSIDIRPSLHRALTELQAERSRIDRQISAVTQALGTIGGKGAAQGGSTAAGGRKRAKRTRPEMTEAQKKAVSKRMKAYWAKRHASEK
jgi:hypothetical protein